MRHGRKKDKAMQAAPMDKMMRAEDEARKAPAKVDPKADKAQRKGPAYAQAIAWWSFWFG